MFATQGEHHVTACPFINIHSLYSCRLFAWGSHCASTLNHVILTGGGDSINSSIARLPLTSFRQERRKNKQRERAVKAEILNLSLKFKQTLINFDSPLHSPIETTGAVLVFYNIFVSPLSGKKREVGWVGGNKQRKKKRVTKIQSKYFGNIMVRALPMRMKQRCCKPCQCLAGSQIDGLCRPHQTSLLVSPQCFVRQRLDLELSCLMYFCQPGGFSNIMRNV